MLRRLAIVLLVPVVALSFAVVACGGDDDENTNGAGGASIPERTLTARDFSFDFPESIEGGLVQLKMDNRGQESHHAQTMRLNDGVTTQQFQTALQSPDPEAVLALVSLAGGPNTIEPGESQTVVADFSRPGNYAFLCFISGADDVPHAAKGMVRTFQVTQPSASQQRPPEADTRVTLADFSFLGLDSLPARKTTIEVTNGGPQPHEVAILKLEGGFTAEQLRALFLDESAELPAGPPPFKSAGGVAGLANGMKSWAEVDLDAGNYALICFVPDATTGAPHAALGMLKGITVR